MEQDYRIKFPDLRTGLSSNSSAPDQLSFYRHQLSVAPQPLSGSVILTTSGFTAKQAFNLNNKLLKQSRRFVNEVNQSINADQNKFALKEVRLAELDLKNTKRKLELFREKMEILVFYMSKMRQVRLSLNLNLVLLILKLKKLRYVVNIGILTLQKFPLFQIKLVN